MKDENLTRQLREIIIGKIKKRFRLLKAVLVALLQAL